MTGGINDVYDFWEKNPLWTGESQYPIGSYDFFEEHRKTLIADCFAGRFDDRILPLHEQRDHVLDLGCGSGYWTVELLLKGCSQVTASDLTPTALNLTKARCITYAVHAELSRQNAECMTFEDGTFSHVNCQGVIHHTPDTAECVREIARVLRPGGTASISVYYRNCILRNWKYLSWGGKLLAMMGGRLNGRGRERLFCQNDINEIVRLYDGKDNPVGKSYDQAEFVSLLTPYFHVKEMFLHFFPARALPFRLAAGVHRLLDRHVGFMIYANLLKK